MAVKVLELHHHGIRVGPSPTDVKKAYSFVVRSELSNQMPAACCEDGPTPILQSRSEERTRWLHFADLALGHSKLREVLAHARQERDAIKRKIRPQIDKLKKLRKL